MITDIDVWKFIHILLFVYWLGADLGVFLLAKAARRSDLTFDQRVISLRMAMKIDILPRLSFALMFPVGLELSAAKGLVEPVDEKQDVDELPDVDVGDQTALPSGPAPATSSGP